jgi:UDP-glucose 4-epimerase
VHYSVMGIVMAVLVTGGAGYIGSHMVWQLLDNGEDVVVLDRLSTGFDWAVPMEAKLIVGDIGNAELVSAIIAKHKIESIIHFAALTVVPDSFTDPIGYYENNTAKAMALIGAAVRTGVKNFIFSSTAAVYGTTGVDPVDENHSTLPVSPYGMSKLMTERVLADACEASGMKYTILRYFNVAGADPKGRTGQSTPAATHLIKAACEAATGKRRALTVFGTDYPSTDGTCERDFIHVSDLVELHYRALCRLCQKRYPIHRACDR